MNFNKYSYWSWSVSSFRSTYSIEFYYSSCSSCIIDTFSLTNSKFHVLHMVEPVEDGFGVLSKTVGHVYLSYTIFFLFISFYILEWNALLRGYSFNTCTLYRISKYQQYWYLCTSDYILCVDFNCLSCPSGVLSFVLFTDFCLLDSPVFYVRFSNYISTFITTHFHKLTTVIIFLTSCIQICIQAITRHWYYTLF